MIDVAGGVKVPRKDGRGVVQYDLLLINKIDLAGAVGVSLELMEREVGQVGRVVTLIQVDLLTAPAQPRDAVSTSLTGIGTYSDCGNPSPRDTIWSTSSPRSAR